MEASTTGLLLWFNTIIPTLLPFIILSNIIIRLDAMSYLTWFLSPILTRLLGISKNGCYAVITGFLCGYPIGSKVTADLVMEQQISPVEGQYLLSFCNNVSPMFIISFIVTVTLKDPSLIIPFLVILYAAPLFTAFVLNPFYRHKMRTAGQMDQKEKASRLQINFKIIDTSIMNGFETVTKLGGYIISVSYTHLDVYKRQVIYGRQIFGPVDRPVDISDILHRDSRVQGICDFHNRTLPHTIRDEICAGVQQYGTLHPVGPVIIMSQPSKAGFDPADDHGGFLIDLPDQVTVDHRRIVRSFPHDTARRVGVRAPPFLRHRVMVYHGIHIAARHQKGQPWLTINRDTLFFFPVGLGNDTHPVAM